MDYADLFHLVSYCIHEGLDMCGAERMPSYIQFRYTI